MWFSKNKPQEATPRAVPQDCPEAADCAVRIAGVCDGKYLLTDDKLFFLLTGWVPLIPVPLIPEPLPLRQVAPANHQLISEGTNETDN